MTKQYEEKLVELAQEIREIQLKESESFKGKRAEISFETLQLNAKINYLLGYIMALKI